MTMMMKEHKIRLGKLQINFICLLCGLAAGYLVRLVFSQEIGAFIATQLCGTVVTIFFNLLKMLIVPIVFCSMALSVGDFSDITQLGKVGVKTFLYFVVFSCVGILVGYGVFRLIPCGSSALLDMMDLVDATPDTVSTASTVWENIRTFILAIFPSNIVTAWMNNEILAVIFMAILFGTAAARLGETEKGKIVGFFKTANSLICRITTMVMSMMPVVVFCSMVRIAINLDLNKATDLLLYLGDLLIGFALMFAVFTLALALGRIDPLKFFRDFEPTLFTAFSIASSTAVIPTSLECCNRAGISKKVSNFVIPLGATINMNGSCIVLIVTCLFMARCYNVAITPNTLLLLALMILLFSMAAPGVPGSLIVMLASLLGILDIPADATDLIIGISTLVGMFMVPVNSIGDALVSALIDKREGSV